MANCIVARSQTPAGHRDADLLGGPRADHHQEPGRRRAGHVRRPPGCPAAPPRWPTAASMAGPTRTPAAAPGTSPIAAHGPDAPLIGIRQEPADFVEAVAAIGAPSYHSPWGSRENASIDAAATETGGNPVCGCGRIVSTHGPRRKRYRCAAPASHGRAPGAGHRTSRRAGDQAEGRWRPDRVRQRR